MVDWGLPEGARRQRDTPFAETAGYGPNETAAVVSIPCTGAGTSTVRLRGCTENNTCTESPARQVTITG